MGGPEQSDGRPRASDFEGRGGQMATAPETGACDGTRG
jgi:hypothetical protein